jgi:hypothetical protein
VSQLVSEWTERRQTECVFVADREPNHSCVQQVARRLPISVFLVLRNGGGRVTTTARSAPPLRLAAPRACCENSGSPRALHRCAQGLGAWALALGVRLWPTCFLSSSLLPWLRSSWLSCRPSCWALRRCSGMFSNNPKRRATARAMVRALLSGGAADSEHRTPSQLLLFRKVADAQHRPENRS